MLLEIHQRGAVADTLALRPVVDAEGCGRGVDGERRTPDQIDQGSGANLHADLPREARTGLATEGEGDGAQERGEPVGGACRGRDDARQTLGEDMAGTGGSGAEELAHAQEQPEWRAAPGEISRATFVVTMDARGRLSTAGTDRRRRGGAHGDDQCLVLVEDVFEEQSGSVWEQGGWERDRIIHNEMIPPLDCSDWLHQTVGRATHRGKRIFARPRSRKSAAC
jgi:hypothetical protein